MNKIQWIKQKTEPTNTNADPQWNRVGWWRGGLYLNCKVNLRVKGFSLGNQLLGQYER